MVLIVEGTHDLGLELVVWRIHRHTQALDMLAPARYNTGKAICGMSTRSAHTEMKSPWLKALHARLRRTWPAGSRTGELV